MDSGVITHEMKRMYPIQNERAYNICIFFIFLFSFFVSLMGGVLLFISLLFIFKKATIYGFLFPLFVIATIIFTQYSTVYDGDYDIVRYYSNYSTLSNCDFTTALLLIGLFGDYFFYFIVYLLSQIFPNDPRVMGFFFALVTGGIMLLTYENIALYLSNNKKANYLSSIHLIVWAMGFIFFMNFVNYANAYRQFFATSLFLWGFSRYLLYKKCLFIFILALFSHWSILMYIVPLFIFRFHYKSLYVCLFLAFSLGVFDISSKLNFADFEKTSNYVQGEILGVDKHLILTLLFTASTLSYVLYKFDQEKKIYFLSLIFVLWDFLFLRSSTIATRLFFSVSQLFAIIFPLILLECSKGERRTYIDLLSLSAFFLFIYNMKNIYLSEFTFLIFTEYSLWYSVYDILSAPFPTEIIL